MRYFDSGVLLKLYLPEPNAAQAVALVLATGCSPSLTPLHLLEMRSAIRQKQGRKTTQQVTGTNEMRAIESACYQSQAK